MKTIYRILLSAACVAGAIVCLEHKLGVLAAILILAAIYSANAKKNATH